MEEERGRKAAWAMAEMVLAVDTAELAAASSFCSVI
jgi:hypothetical protein